MWGLQVTLKAKPHGEAKWVPRGTRMHGEPPFITHAAAMGVPSSTS